MKHLNKIVLQLTKRLALVVLFVGISNAVWAWESHGRHYTQVEANVELDGDSPSSAKGYVYVSESELDKEPNYDEAPSNPTYNNSGVYREYSYKKYRDCADEGGESADHNHVYYFYAKNPSEGTYLWGGWYKDGDFVSDVQNGYQSAAITAQRTPEWIAYNDGYYASYPDVDLTLTAKWLVPRVTMVNSLGENIEIPISHNNPNESISEDIVFTLTDSKSHENFTLTVDNVKVPTEEAAYESIGLYTYTATINPTKKHGQSTTKTITLTSDFKGKDGAFTSKTAIIKVTEDYTPKFEAIPEPYTFIVTDNNVMYSEDRALTPSYMNIPASLSPDGNGKNGTIWTTTIDEEDDYQHFEISSGNNTSNPIVSFQMPENSEKTKYTATLRITCHYIDNMEAEVDPKGTDGEGNELSPEVTEKVITLQAVSDPVIYFEGEEDYIDEDIIKVICGTGASREYDFVTNTTLGTPNWTGGTDVTYELNEETKKVKIAVPSSTLPGTYEPLLTLSGTGKDADNNDVTVDATLKVTAKVELATPELAAYGANEQVLLLWDEVPEATYYIITKNGVTDSDLIGQGYNENIAGEGNTWSVIEGSNTTSTSIENLNNEVSYDFYITALHVRDGKIIDSKTSEKKSAAPANVPGTITKSNAANTGLYTGTEGENTAFPYMPKRPIDVSAAFSGDIAQFDRLYLFGLTTGESIDYENANTPCYIYERTDAYTYTRKYTIANMNVDKKDNKWFEISTSGQKMYFTGYCPFATCGTTWEDNAVVHVSGASPIDIYLDNLQLYARSKNGATFTVTKKDENWAYVWEEVTPDKEYIGYPVGSGAVFAFSSTTSDIDKEPFRPTIHVRSSNILDATVGLKIKQTISSSSTYTIYSSPIQILPMINGENNRTTLKIDDIWHDLENVGGADKNTGGKLFLQEKQGGTGGDYTENNPSPSIDMGNSYTQIEIAGGQIVMQNASKDDTGKSFAMAYAYGLSTSSGVTIRYYGMIDSNTFPYDVSNGTVQFLDGTISNATGNATALNCPTNTTIDGGSFNCAIIAGGSSEIKNTDGKILKRISADIVESVGTIEDGLVAFKTEWNEESKDGFQVLMDNLFPKANFQTKDGETDVYASLSGYYTGGTTYGHASLAPEGYSVYLMLPQDGEIGSYTGWSLCVPEVKDITYNVGGSATVLDKMGGDTDVTSTTTIPVSAGNLKLTNRLLYAEIDDVTEAVIIESGGESKDGHSVTNEEEYTISEKVYMLLPVIAGQWKMIVPPFDIHNVYVIESYPEEQLKKVYGVEKKAGTGRYYINDQNMISLARKAQAKRFMELMGYWMGYDDLDTDFFGKTPDSYGPFVNTWINYVKGVQEGKFGATGEGVELVEGDYTPNIEQIYHYTGTKGTYPSGMQWYDANYYLYKSSGNWTYDEGLAEEGDETFVTTWEEVTVQSVPRATGTPNIIMNRGEVYSMQFPGAPTDWNYWTGKYILLEGYGPQTIYGSSDITIATGPDYGTASLHGNASFAQKDIHGTYLMELLPKKDDSGSDIEGVYDFTTPEYVDLQLGPEGKPIQDEDGNFIPVTDEQGNYFSTITLSPSEGYMLANLNESTRSVNEQGETVLTQKRLRTVGLETGEATFDISTTVLNDDNSGSTTGVPTIMGDVSLVVVPTEQGLQIVPLAPQQVMLFSAEGKLIFSEYLSEEKTLPLSSGVYVVRGERDQVKVLKK